MKALTLGILEVVAWVDHGELDLGSVGEVDRLIDQQPARLHAALERERHGARLPLDSEARHRPTLQGEEPELTHAVLTEPDMRGTEELRLGGSARS